MGFCSQIPHTSRVSSRRDCAHQTSESNTAWYQPLEIMNFVSAFGNSVFFCGIGTVLNWRKIELSEMFTVKINCVCFEIVSLFRAGSRFWKLTLQLMVKYFSNSSRALQTVKCFSFCHSLIWKCFRSASHIFVWHIFILTTIKLRNIFVFSWMTLKGENCLLKKIKTKVRFSRYQCQSTLMNLFCMFFAKYLMKRFNSYNQHSENFKDEEQNYTCFALNC